MNLVLCILLQYNDDRLSRDGKNNYEGNTEKYRESCNNNGLSKYLKLCCIANKCKEPHQLEQIDLHTIHFQPICTNFRKIVIFVSLFVGDGKKPQDCILATFCSEVFHLH